MRPRQITRFLLLFALLALATSTRAQSGAQSKIDCSPGFEGIYRHTTFTHYEISFGCLTVADGAVRFRSGAPEWGFDFPIVELVSLKKSKSRMGPIHLNGFTLKLKNGKKYEFYVEADRPSGDEIVESAQKALRDAAASAGVHLEETS
jgi:hypothetical protein